MPTVHANGIELYYEDEGTGDPILLIMGLGGQLVDWPQRMVDALVAAGHRVLRLDNRDVGLSQGFDWEPPGLTRTAAAILTRRKVDADYTISDMADDAAGLLGAIGVDSAHVVGASMGGMIAQSMAIRHPERVRSLCSIMSNPGDRKSGRIAKRVLRKLARAEQPTRENAPEVLTDQYEWWAGSSWNRAEHLLRTKAAVERSWRPEGTSRQFAAILASPDRTEELRRITVPTLIVHGMEDTLVKPSGGMATARAVPGSRLILYPDMGHDLPASRNDELVEAIVRNARRASGAPTSS